MVERVDVYGVSLTFRPPGGRFVYACLAPQPGSRWCGHVAGELRQGLLTDPRLDVSCRARNGTPIGTVWIDPVAGARWIVVRDPQQTQIYRTAASLPLRVSTETVDLETATATFDVEQYDATGARVSETTIRARVAG